MIAHPTIRNAYHLLTILISFVVLIVIPSTLFALESPFSFRTAPIYAQTKIFLVAGSGQTANFAQEVLEQKRIWMRAGFSEEEIACYYATPNVREFRRDQEQFVRIAPLLSQCYPASVSLIRRHMQLIGRGHERPPFLYLYVTSHGERPLSYRVAKTRTDRMERKLLEEKSRYPVLNQYLLRIDGLEDHPASFEDLLSAYRAGEDPEELFMTPIYLRNLLEMSFKDVPKFLVLQGCYSGGFVEDPSQAFGDQGLKNLSPITLLTAARHDRASFGCEPGVVSTYFGGIYNEVLEGRGDDPRRMDWKALFERVKEKVKEKEIEEERRPPSEPTFYSNFPREGEAPAPEIQPNL